MRSFLPGSVSRSTESAETGLTGLTGLAADLIDAIGEVGVGLLAFVETVFPPIPSEIILSLSGYLAERGQLNVVLVVIAATLGGLLGGLVLYGLGAWFGEDRARKWLTVLPLVEDSDFEKASVWFHKHGQPAVFFGRFVPIVRSLISLPAGVQRMPLWTFASLTAAGSLIWNTALVGAGYALGTQYDKVEEWMAYLDYVIFATVAALLVLYLRQKFRQSKDVKSGRHRA